MGYKTATSILPNDLLAAIQQFVDGESIYIPRRDENRKQWGECSDSRQRLERRNIAILEQYQCRVPVEVLSRQYYLSPKTIYKILSAQRNRS